LRCCHVPLPGCCADAALRAARRRTWAPPARGASGGASLPRSAALCLSAH
jgi:hypothetical protein